MVRMAMSIGHSQLRAGRGLEMQAAGMVGLLFGVVLIVFLSSFSGHLGGASLVAAAGALALVGVVFFREYAGSVLICALGTLLIFSGVGIIAGSSIAAAVGWITQVENTVAADVGATVTACGFVLSAYSFFVLRGHA
jgi:hypothetical protein